MEQEKLQYFKEKLENEKMLLEKEMSTVGKRNPENPSDWEAASSEMDISTADQSEMADENESYGANSAILDQLETRYNYVLQALERIESGGYGKCKIDGKEIEEERLEANPASETCIKHRDEK